MNNIIFLGPSSKDGKGGISYVLNAYKTIFPNSIFIATTAASHVLINYVYLITALLKFIFILIVKRNIKIVHIHSASYSSFCRKYIFFKISQLFNKKIIFHIHGGEFHIFYKEARDNIKEKIKKLIEGSDFILCLSNYWMNYFTSHFKINKIEIIPNIIIPPISINKANNEDNLKRFLFLGHIGRNKGIWFLLDVLRSDIIKFKGISKFFIGGDGDVKMLKRKIEEYKLTDVVEYVGWLSGKNKDYYFSNSDVFILPSYNEGLPISILEAMSYKLPILSTNVGGISEIVSDENGILINPGENLELKNAILFFLTNESTSMGEKSYEKVKKYFPDEVHNKLKNIYSTFLND